MHGTFENGQPKIKIEIRGNGSSQTVEAVVDSGFNGYLKIPYRTAFPLGLSLVAVGSGTVADGNMSANLVCEGEACIGSECARITIDVHPAEITLIGTGLLKALSKGFYLDVTNGIVEITDIKPAEPSSKGFALKKEAGSNTISKD